MVEEDAHPTPVVEEELDPSTIMPMDEEDPTVRHDLVASKLRTPPRPEQDRLEEIGARLVRRILAGPGR